MDLKFYAAICLSFPSKVTGSLIAEVLCWVYMSLDRGVIQERKDVKRKPSFRHDCCGEHAGTLHLQALNCLVSVHVILSSDVSMHVQTFAYKSGLD